MPFMTGARDGDLLRGQHLARWKGLSRPTSTRISSSRSRSGSSSGPSSTTAGRRRRTTRTSTPTSREQKQLPGRFGAPINNWAPTKRRWPGCSYQEVVPGEANALMLIIALLFLLVCSVNLIGILLGKFLARAPEVGVRRALGASRRWVFVQHLLECELIGVIAGVHARTRCSPWSA